MTEPNDLADRLRRACDERIRQAVTEAQNRRLMRAAVREEFARRRRAGLVARRLARRPNPRTEEFTMDNTASFDQRMLRALADLTELAISRQQPHVQDQLRRALADGNTRLTADRSGITVWVDGRELVMAPWTAVDVQ